MANQGQLALTEKGRRQDGDAAPLPANAESGNDFSLYYDQALTKRSPYHGDNDYFRKARDRMDRTFAKVQAHVRGGAMLDVGASPFYLLDRALKSGAKEVQGIYFANDEHPLRGLSNIYSRHGEIGLHHLNIETDDLPFADNSFDLVTACEILEHLEYFPARFGGEVKRILRPDGILCLTVPNVSSIGNILKLVLQKNIFMKYRSDATGRHKHEYTLAQLKALVEYLEFETVESGFFPSPTSNLMWLRPIYRALARIPGIRCYSPVLYILGRQPQQKSNVKLGRPPAILYSTDKSIEG